MLRSKRRVSAKSDGAARGERECVPVSGRALDRVAGENRHGEPQRRDLGERQIHEDHAAGENMQPEPRVYRRQHESRDERPEQELRHGRFFDAAASCATLSSKSFR